MTMDLLQVRGTLVAITYLHFISMYLPTLSGQQRTIDGPWQHTLLLG